MVMRPLVVSPMRRLMRGKEIRDRVPERIEMLDDAIRPEIRDRRIGIAEGHTDDRDASVFRRVDIGAAVADHHGAGFVAAGCVDGAQEMTGIGLAEEEGVAAADRLQPGVKTETAEELPRQTFELVGADGKMPARSGEAIERIEEPRKWRAHPGMLLE